MKKLAALCIALIGMVSLTSFMNATAIVPDPEYKVTIEMNLDENYYDTNPFINERLFCVSEDLDTLTAEVTFEMDGESGILEVKNNKTNEVLWSNSWEENVKPETFTISLKDLKKDDEYVVCFTGTKINQATIEITFESELVQEREKPLR